MAPEASPPEPCSRTRHQTSPLPFLRPYRRMPAQQLLPRPTTSPAALPTGRVRGDRGLRRLGSGSPSPESTTTRTKMATRKALPENTSVEAGDYTYAEEEERGPHGFTVPSPVSPPTDLISCPQSDSGYECSPLEQPPSYFPTPPIPSDRCPSQYHKARLDAAAASSWHRATSGTPADARRNLRTASDAVPTGAGGRQRRGEAVDERFVIFLVAHFFSVKQVVWIWFADRLESIPREGSNDGKRGRGCQVVGLEKKSALGLGLNIAVPFDGWQGGKQ
ncbi:hypothetical protein IWZ03DRAFT_66605 [Phyllosticta citriasiana]|uniref:Uncharacterized protein n=1 Tax=Phyllosticta citriasiana TaxID=595635 RepID=A0ABR1KEC6_9PEZI